jgi:hypothetical protein
VLPHSRLQRRQWESTQRRQRSPGCRSAQPPANCGVGLVWATDGLWQMQCEVLHIATAAQGHWEISMACSAATMWPAAGRPAPAGRREGLLGGEAEPGDAGECVLPAVLQAPAHQLALQQGTSSSMTRLLSCSASSAHPRLNAAQRAVLAANCRRRRRLGPRTRPPKKRAIAYM